MLGKSPSLTAEMRGHLGQPDDGFRSLHLAEEWAVTTELVVPPVLQQPRRLRRHVPLVRIREAPPQVNPLSELVNDRGRVILLLLGGEALVCLEGQVPLALASPAFLWLGDRRDELRPPASRDQRVGRLAIPIEFPVLSRVVVGRVADRSLEKGISHTRCAGRPKTAAVYVLVTTRIAVESATAYQERR